jgi:hypothetical protein
MFKFFKSKPKTPPDQRIEAITNLLFPPLQLHTDSKGNKYHIDYSVDMNLDAALVDLEEGNNDEISRKTIKSVSDRLFKLRQYLEVQREFDSEIKYVLVEDLQTNIPLEDIKAIEE